MNRQKKELLKKYTPEQIKEMREKEMQEQREDAKNYPELYSFMYDSWADVNDRRLGISPLNKAARDYIRKRFEMGEYPERLHHLVWAELSLKGSEET